MSLTPTDYDNIKLLINTTSQIYYYYCQLIKLEKNNHINNKYNTILKRIETFENTENNLLVDLIQNPDKIELILKNIKDNTMINLLIKERIFIKLKNQINKILFKELLINFKNKNIQQGNFIQNEIKQTLTDDIFNMFRYFINQEIKNSSNKYIKEQLIDFKYKDLFLGLNTSKDIKDYINIKEVTLNFDFIYNFLEFVRHLKHNEDEKSFIKSIYINDKIKLYINELLSIGDEQISNEDTIIKTTILKSYIKACLSFLNKEEKEYILDKINKQYSDTISKHILMDSLNETDKPIIKSVKLKIK